MENRDTKIDANTPYTVPVKLRLREVLIWIYSDLELYTEWRRRGSNWNNIQVKSFIAS